jgi:hypothetical protein
VLTGYSLMLPPTSGWSVALDGSRFLLGSRLEPPSCRPSASAAIAEMVASTFAAACAEGGPDAAAVPGAQEAWQSLGLQHPALQPSLQAVQAQAQAQAAAMGSSPFLLAFALRCSRTISASSAVTALMSLELAEEEEEEEEEEGRPQEAPAAAGAAAGAGGARRLRPSFTVTEELHIVSSQRKA